MNKNKKIGFSGLEDLPKTICDDMGHKPIAKNYSSQNGWTSMCANCTNIIFYLSENETMLSQSKE